MSPKQDAKARRAQMAPYRGEYAVHLPEIREMLANGIAARQIAESFQSEPYQICRMQQLIRYIARRDKMQAMLAKEVAA